MRLTAQPGHLRCARTRPPLCEACELGERGNHRVGHRPRGWSPPTLRGPHSGQVGRLAAASSCAGVRRAEDRGWQRSHRVGVRALRRDDGRPGLPGPGGRAAEPWSPVVPDPGWLWSRGGRGVVGRGRRDDRAGPCRQPGRARPCRRVGDHRCGRPGGGRGASVRSGVAASGVTGYGRCRGVPAVAGGAARLRAGGVDRSGRGDRCGGGVGGGRGRTI